MTGACPVCRSSDVDVRGPYRGTHKVFRELKRAHCFSCGMIFATPMPSGDVLDAYNSTYFSSAHGGKPSTPIARAFFSAIARLRLAYVERYLRGRNIDVSRLLEWGPGLGFFARSWLEAHPASSYSAIETDASCHPFLTELGVRLLDDILQMQEEVDLVVMSHVLEHVPDPGRFLTSADRALRRGGAIFIEVPCRDWEHKAIDEPHLLFFDKGPMCRLLRGLGFTDIEVSYHGQEIQRLRAAPPWRDKWMAVRSKLISSGFVAPFAATQPGMEALTDPLERAAVAPFKAHCESAEPAWWLRAVARKDW